MNPDTIELERIRIAVVHEWVAARAGSEKTFEALAAAFPAADLFALTIDPDVRLETGGREIRTTVLDRQFLRDHRAPILPFMPWAWERMAVDAYDLVVTSSHAFARTFPAARHAVHIDYCHTPMRYLWAPELDTRSRILAPAIRGLGGRLRVRDRESVRSVDRFLANSRETARRIRTWYGCDATVVPPPVDTNFFADAPLVPWDQRRESLVAYGRMIPYKRFDLAIDTAAASGLHLDLIGGGPDEAQLHAHASRVGADVTFHGRASDEELRALVGSARALIFPGLEDFGLVPVEAQAAGTPVVAFGQGGALDTVGPTGVLVSEQTGEALAAGVWELLERGMDPGDARRSMESFSTDRFKRRMRQLATEALAAAACSA